MQRIFCSLCVLFYFGGLASSQDHASWTKLTKADAEKILNFSAWGQTQIDTDTTEMMYSPTRPGTSAIGQPMASRSTPNSQQSINNNRADQGAANEAIAVNYRIRLLSAKPIREAISRMVLFERGQTDENLELAMQSLIDRDFSKWIVICVTIDSTDGRYSGPAIQAFESASADTLRNKTYLERKDGKRLFLLDYRAPTNDGLGAKFVFERASEAEPFITADSGTFRFYSEVGDKIKLNVKYKLADLTYNGKLEY
jgi:hypothetical protein